LDQVRRRTDMFNEEQIAIIFGNTETLLEFQLDFVDQLESTINWQQPHKSCVGQCFKKYVSIGRSVLFETLSRFC
jgi:hypothetical protein